MYSLIVQSIGIEEWQRDLHLNSVYINNIGVLHDVPHDGQQLLGLLLLAGLLPDLFVFRVSPRGGIHHCQLVTVA